MIGRSLVRRQPRSVFEFEPVFNTFDRIFSDDFFRPVWASGTEVWNPPVDILEKDDSYLVTAELPGLSKQDIDLTVENKVLTLKGERTRDEKVENETYRRLERSYGSFSRSFVLPSEVDADRVEAKFKDGLLTITLPKSESVKPRHIAVS